MKKTMKMVGMSLLFLILLTACSSGSTSLEGKWGLSKMEVDGVNALSALDTAEEITGEKINLEDIMYYEFTKDGKYMMVMTRMDQKEEGTYKLRGKKITLTSDGEDIEGTVDGNTLTIPYGSGEIIVRSFTKK